MSIGVLVFPAGEINSIELHDALSTCVNIRLYGASSVDRHGGFVFKNYISGLPMISDPVFFDRFNKVLSENKIDAVFPTHDTVTEFLTANRDKVAAKLITSDARTAAVCRDKAETFALFNGESFCPRVFEKPDTFPVFIKPRKGQGSVGAKKLQAYEPVELNDYVICEYLPGEEYTVDCVTDMHGALCAVLPRSRQRLFGGVCTAGKSEPLTNEIEHIAKTINARLNFLGLWYFQIKKDINGAFKLLEISARCAGTMCLSRAKGINLPLLSVYAAMGYEIEAAGNRYAVSVDRTLISRYKIGYAYDTVYIDYDDTVIINGAVHLPAIWFLYQCRRDRKKVILLTRHNHDHEDTTEESLAAYCIPAGLFAEIVDIPAFADKSGYINPDKAIFIDNAYAERKAVREAHGIPVFDVEGLEVLMDWRN
jgi:hypothetical protein